MKPEERAEKLAEEFADMAIFYQREKDDVLAFGMSKRTAAYRNADAHARSAEERCWAAALVIECFTGREAGEHFTELMRGARVRRREREEALALRGAAVA